MKIRQAFKKYAAPVVAGMSLVAVGAANAATDISTYAADLQTDVTGSATTAAATGFAVLTVVLGLSVGFALLSSFVRKGARG